MAARTLWSIRIPLPWGWDFRTHAADHMNPSRRLGVHRWLFGQISVDTRTHHLTVGFDRLRHKIRMADERRLALQRQLAGIIDGLVLPEDGLHGGSCPLQIEGELPDGAQLYFRFRHNTASLEITDVDGSVTVGRVEDYYPDDPDIGWFIEPSDLVDCFEQCYQRMAPVSEDNPTGAMVIVRAVEEMSRS